MAFTRRGILGMASGAVAAPMLLRGGRAGAQAAVTLKLHHFLPPASNGHAKLLAPWAKQVEADSQGALKIEIYPSMQMGGTPAHLYDQVRDGVGPTSSGPFPARPPAASRQPRCSSYPSSRRASAPSTPGLARSSARPIWRPRSRTSICWASSPTMPA